MALTEEEKKRAAELTREIFELEHSGRAGAFQPDLIPLYQEMQSLFLKQENQKSNKTIGGKMKEAKPVIIHWKDCCYNSGNTYSEKELGNFELAELVTIGQGIEREDDWLLYAEYNQGEETYRHIICLPKTGIIKVTYLEMPQEPIPNSPE